MSSSVTFLALVELSYIFTNSFVAHGAILNVEFAGSSSTVTVDGEPWFQSAEPFLQADSSAASLSLRQYKTERGTDSAFGDFISFVQDWEVNARFSVIHSIRWYVSQDFAEFSTKFPDGVDGTSVNDSDGVCAAFTAFHVTGPPNGSLRSRGFASWAGNMLSDKYTKFGVWDQNAHGIQGGKNGSLMAIFDEQKLTTVVMSASSQFMAANFLFNRSSTGSVLQLGVMGSVTSIPPGFEMSFILSAGRGPNAAFSAWGNTLLSKYGKTNVAREDDFTLKYLGYSTDNGAYYYYHVENATQRWQKPTSFEQTQVDLKAYAVKSGIPYRYILLDSWWYLKGKDDGVTVWTADPAVYPNGLYNMWKQTGWPVQGHNRWWSAETPYAKQNGGTYEFIVEAQKHKAIPVEQRFWEDLFANSTKWGLTNYEQDWLHNEFEGLNCTLESATLARKWLLQMGSAASNNGIKIQYCMAWPRHVLQSVEVAAVSNFRASDDYQSDPGQWKLGLSSLIANALGLAPSKDNYWSKHEQPGNNWNLREPYSELQSAVSSFTAGPVAPSDMIGHSNVELILRACNADGLLLKPSRPATSIDSTFAFRAFGRGGPDGEILATHSDLGSLRFHHVLIADLKQPFNLSTSELPGYDSGSRTIAYEGGDTSVTNVTLLAFDAQHPIYLGAVGKSDFRVLHVAPVLLNGWAILGELAKWIPTSPERILQVTVEEEGLSVSLRGASGEDLEISLLTPSNTVLRASCKLPASGVATLWVPTKSQIPAAVCREVLDMPSEHIVV